MTAVPKHVVVRLVGALVGVAGLALSAAPAAQAALRVPIVVAHRGGVVAYPENSYPGLVRAAELGEIVETDVRFTSDHVAVLSHDADTTRVFSCTGGRNFVIAHTTFALLNRNCLTRSMLSRDGAKYHLARYASVLSVVHRISGVRLWPEIKTTMTDADARLFLGPLITDRLLAHTRITSFIGSQLLFIRHAALVDFRVRAVHTLLYEYGRGVALSVAQSDGVDAIGLSYYTVHAQLAAVAKAHAAGIGVAVYNAEDATHWANLRALGVDWIITGHPAAYSAWAR